MTDEGDVKSYLGMNVRNYPNETINIRQPANVILTKYFSGASCREDAYQVRPVLSRTGYIKKIRKLSNRLGK